MNPSQNAKSNSPKSNIPTNTSIISNQNSSNLNSHDVLNRDSVQIQDSTSNSKVSTKDSKDSKQLKQSINDTQIRELRTLIACLKSSVSNKIDKNDTKKELPREIQDVTPPNTHNSLSGKVSNEQNDKFVNHDVNGDSIENRNESATSSSKMVGNESTAEKEIVSNDCATKNEAKNVDKVAASMFVQNYKSNLKQDLKNGNNLPSNRPQTMDSKSLGRNSIVESLNSIINHLKNFNYEDFSQVEEDIKNALIVNFQTENQSYVSEINEKIQNCLQIIKNRDSTQDICKEIEKEFSHEPSKNKKKVPANLPNIITTSTSLPSQNPTDIKDSTNTRIIPRSASLFLGKSPLGMKSQNNRPQSAMLPVQPVETLQPPSYPYPSLSSSYYTHKRVLVTSTNQYIQPPPHSHSSFTEIGLIKAICLPFNSMIPSVQELQEYLDPIFFINEPPAHFPHCIHHMPQFVLGFTTDTTYKKDIQAFDRIALLLREKFPYIQPYIIVFFEGETKIKMEAYIIHISRKHLADHLSLFKKNLLSKFKAFAKRVIEQPETFYSATTTHEQKIIESTGKQLRGDYFMLTGYFNRAREEFEQNIEVAKSTGDWLSLAMSYEGIAACLWFDAKKNFPLGKIPENILQKILKSYQSFLSTIEKRNDLKLFYVHMLLRLAQFYADIKEMSPHFTVEALSIINDAMVLASIQTVQTKVTLYGIASLICLQMGCFRKYGYYLRQVSQLHSELGYKQNLAMYYITKAFESYRIPLEYHENKIGEKFKVIEPIENGGWKLLQVECVKDAIKIASSLYPPAIQEEIQLSFFILSLWHSVISQQEQQKLFNRICQLSEHLASGISSCIYPLPLVHSIAPNSMSRNRIPEEDPSMKVKQHSIFEYTNLDLGDEKKVETIHWVQDDIASVTLILHNPLLIQLQLISVSMETNIPCTIYPVPASISPKGVTELCINLRPHTITDDLNIKNVLLSFAHNAKFADPIVIPASFSSNYLVKVIPPMPLLDIDLSDKIVEIYEGEYKKFRISLSNVGSVPIDFLKCTLVAKQNEPKDFLNYQLGDLKIQPGQLVSTEFSVNGTLFLNNQAYTPLNVDNVLEYSLHFEYKCNRNPLWLRRSTFVVSVLTKPSLILDACVSMNQANTKQIVGRISNFASEPIMLLSQTSGEDEEDLYQSYAKGVTIGPSHTKIVLLKNHIPAEVIDKIPYSIRYLHNYSKYFAQYLKWKGTVSNATGIVSVRPPNERELAFEELDDDSSRDDIITSELDLEEKLPQSFSQLTLQYKSHNNLDTEISTKDKHCGQVSSLETVPLYSTVSCISLIRSSLYTRGLNCIVNIRVLYDGSKGLKQASSKQFMYSGVLTFPLNTSMETQEHSCDIWFMLQGKYHIQVSCETVNGEAPIVEPKRISIVCM